MWVGFHPGTAETNEAEARRARKLESCMLMLFEGLKSVEIGILVATDVEREFQRRKLRFKKCLGRKRSLYTTIVRTLRKYVNGDGPISSRIHMNA